MSYPYPASPAPYGWQPYRSLRALSVVTVVLIGLSIAGAVLQVYLGWSTYDDVKRAVFGLSSDAELERSFRTLDQYGPLWNLGGYVFLLAGVVFIVWLWQARERTVALDPASAGRPWPSPGLPRGPHRLEQGWVIGSWFCPILQFWYPLRVVQDVAAASEAPAQPGMVRSRGPRGLLYGWWAAWAGYWVILIGGGGLAFFIAMVRMVQLIDEIEQASASNREIEVYALQDFLVNSALALNIGMSVAIGLFVVAGLLISVVILKISNSLDRRGGQQPAPLPPGPAPQVHPQQAGAGHQPAYPTYGGYHPGAQPTPGQTPWRPQDQPPPGQPWRPQDQPPPGPWQPGR